MTRRIWLCMVGVRLDVPAFTVSTQPPIPRVISWQRHTGFSLPMTIQELIDKLKELDPNETVVVWDAYHDEPTTEVHISR